MNYLESIVFKLPTRYPKTKWCECCDQTRPYEEYFCKCGFGYVHPDVFKRDNPPIIEDILLFTFGAVCILCIGSLFNNK